MPQYVAILEVSQKQAYIFGAKRLAENVARSEIIRYVTEELYRECGASEEQLVYAGGGHIILQFSGETAQAAKDRGLAVIQEMTFTAYRRYGLEVFAKLMAYDEEKLPGDNLEELMGQLEKKKSLRLSAFHWVDTGLELEGEERSLASTPRGQEGTADFRYRHPTQFRDLTDEEGKLAIVHIDGNNMGKKSKAVTADGQRSWTVCCERHRAFSQAVDHAFQQALRATIRQVEQAQGSGGLTEAGFSPEDAYHPIRPIIAAGDDICFVTAGRLGLTCAAYFLRILHENSPYTACAGVAVVPEKYPFYRAYQTSEQLCDSAKQYAAALMAEDPAGREYGVLDWHLEFGQGKPSLADTREDYIMEDSMSGEDAEHPIHLMTLRPICVTGQTGEVLSPRSYRYLTNLLRGLRASSVPKGKLKELREKLKQGVEETYYYVRSGQMRQMGKWAFDSRNDHSAAAVFRNGGVRDVDYFTPVQQEGAVYCQRSLYFDAIELVDHVTLWEEEGQE